MFKIDLGMVENSTNEISVEPIGAQVQSVSIEPMTECLHGFYCKFLESTPPGRPVCKQKNKFIFDLKFCPNELWALCC